ncbi:SDR family oxidoreductase [Exercitatus varius]|uniref:SDR family oxidoreductase n=1 Tax=Exercitatus varius TaxID=67857 RepID=UPI00294B6D48|nr:SDR family oxidoreductase [Exercitatus varius]MDG2941609.1 SDR family oxidoreductase [Exercitatus varius]
MQKINKILVVGATGSIGQYVVTEALNKGYQVRALVRNPNKVQFDKRVDVFIGDLTQPDTLKGISDGIDGIIFTQGNYADPENVDYQGVRTIINLLNGRRTKLVLMSTIYSILVVNDQRFDNGCAWKRRTERLIRASHQPYTIIRPSWFDCNEADEQQLFITQGKTNYSLTASDGGISRVQLAETLVQALTVPEAEHKTIELFAEKGERTMDFNRLFATAIADEPTENFDGIKDPNNRPFNLEPANVVQDLQSLAKIKRA